MSAASDALLRSAGLDERIASLSDDGEFEDVADLYLRIWKAHPQFPDLLVLSIAALQNAHLWREADERAHFACETYPDNLSVAVAFARVPFLCSDWAVAASRFRALRARFDPQRSAEAASTIIDELHCYDWLADAAGATSLLADQWTNLGSHDPRSYGDRPALFDAFAFLPREKRPRFAEWSLGAVPADHRTYYLDRLESFGRNADWIEQHAPDVEIVSLGQNCLPWVLLNRWGLRPRRSTFDPFGPFDYMPMIGDLSATALEENCASFLDPECLAPHRLPNGVPILYNGAMGVFFYHEQGLSWARDDWTRVRSAYRARVDRFRSTVRTGRSLYVFCLCGNGDLHRLVDAFERHLDHPAARLLVINVLREPTLARLRSDRVAVLDAPYPDDYNWNSFPHYSSPNGHRFETGIIEAVHRELGRFRDRRGRLDGVRASALAWLAGRFRKAAP